MYTNANSQMPLSQNCDCGIIVVQFVHEYIFILQKALYIKKHSQIKAFWTKTSFCLLYFLVCSLLAIGSSGDWRFKPTN